MLYHGWSKRCLPQMRLQLSNFHPKIFKIQQGVVYLVINKSLQASIRVQPEGRHFLNAFINYIEEKKQPIIIAKATKLSRAEQDTIRSTLPYD